MKINNVFDTRIQASAMPDHFRHAAIELTDTLDVCWAVAQAVFEGKAEPAHAIALLPLFMARADDKHRQLLARFARDTDGEPLPPPAAP